MSQALSPINDPDKNYPISIYTVDKNYAEFLGLEATSGRLFSDEFTSDRHKVMVNQKTVEVLGWGDQALEQTIFDAEIIGVVKDFHNNSLHNAIDPIAFIVRKETTIPEKCLVRFTSSFNTNQVVLIEEIWDRYFPNARFYYDYLPDQVTGQYAADQRFGSILTILTIITILVASVGFFGLSWFTIQQKKKEIAIRKVCGSTNTQIAKRYFARFSTQFFFAALLSWPLTYLVLRKWLEKYVYRADISADLFIFGTIIGLLIILFTIGINILSVVHTNPATTLRDE